MINTILEDVMTEHPIKVKDNMTVGVVAHLLMRYRINGILVVDKEDDTRLIGVFTTTDLLRLLDEALTGGAHRLEELKKISELQVGEVASKEIISMQKEETVMKAVAMMHHKAVHTLPVFDGEKLVGVVGRHDILALAFN